MKLTRVSAKDKSIGGTTHGIKWRYNGDRGEMEVPEKVGLTLIATGDFEAVKAAPKAQTKAKEPTTIYGSDDAKEWLTPATEIERKD